MSWPFEHQLCFFVSLIIGTANYASTGMWRDCLPRVALFGFCLVEDWSMPRGWPHDSWLRQVEACLKDIAWRAWRLPGRWPDGGRSSSEAVHLRGGPGDALLRRMPPYLTSPIIFVHFSDRNIHSNKKSQQLRSFSELAVVHFIIVIQGGLGTFGLS